MPTKQQSSLPRTPSLLSISETKGCPDFGPLYKKAGYEVLQVRSMRKGLVLLKKRVPTVVVAEFVYCPTYGTTISTLESLLASLQAMSCFTKLIIFLEKGREQQLDRLVPRYPIHARFFYPIQFGQLMRCLSEQKKLLGIGTK